MAFFITNKIGQKKNFVHIYHLHKRCEEVGNAVCNTFIRASSPSTCYNSAHPFALNYLIFLSAQCCFLTFQLIYSFLLNLNNQQKNVLQDVVR